MTASTSRKSTLSGLVAGALICSLASSHAWAQISWPKLPSSITDILMPPQGNPKPGEAPKGGFLCGLIGQGAIHLARQKAQIGAERLKLSPDDMRKREERFLMGMALFGSCQVATSVGSQIMKNMTENQRKLEEQAFLQSVNQTGPVKFADPNDKDFRGTVEFVERETLPDGNDCGTRLTTIRQGDDTAESAARMCRRPGSSTYAFV